MGFSKYHIDGFSCSQGEYISARDGAGTEFLEVGFYIVDDIEASERVAIWQGVLLPLHVYGVVKKHGPFAALTSIM